MVVRLLEPTAVAALTGPATRDGRSPVDRDYHAAHELINVLYGLAKKFKVDPPSGRDGEPSGAQLWRGLEHTLDRAIDITALGNYWDELGCSDEEYEERTRDLPMMLRAIADAYERTGPLSRSFCR